MILRSTQKLVAQSEAGGRRCFSKQSLKTIEIYRENIFGNGRRASRKGGISHDSPLLPRPVFPPVSQKQRLAGQSEAGGGRVFCYAANKNS